MSFVNTLALDVGSVRVGMAYAHKDVKVPVPLPTLKRQDVSFWSDFKSTLNKYEIGHLVIGVPRNINGHDTNQTYSTREFIKELTEKVAIKYDCQDEALTSIKAEAELKRRGKPYEKADIDALAACFILSDYLEEQRV